MDFDFSWKADYEVANHEINRQHRDLLKICKDLYDTGHGRSIYGDSVDQCLNDFFEKILHHFNYEIDLLRKRGVPDIDRHEKEHDKIMLRLYELLDTAATKSLGPAPLLAFFASWLVEHVQTVDRNYFGSGIGHRD